MKSNDKISMEFESRVMIDENQYHQILSDFKNEKNIKESVNYNFYYDTPDLALTLSGMVLRFRAVDDSNELTLKVKGEDGDSEITNTLEDPSAPINELLGDTIELVLKLRGINPDNLILVGSLTTERTEIFYEDHILVIDKNYYNDQIDYNLEIESTSKEKAKEYLLPIKLKYGAKEDTAYVSKSRRAILNSSFC